MGFLSKIFGGNSLGTKRFRGQGYSEEGALHHAEQRYQAWLRELSKDNAKVQVANKTTSYIQKNDLLTICYIDCSYEVKK